MSAQCRRCGMRIRLDEEESEWVDDTGSNICTEEGQVHEPEE